MLIVRATLSAVQRLLTEADLKRSPSEELCGIPVYHTSDRFSAEPCLRSVHAALLCLERHDPRRLKSARRFLRRIVIAAQSGNVYWRHSHACVISDLQLSRQPAAWIASAIVHESVHARLHSLGFVPGNLEQRKRQETLCANEEIRFLRNVPDSHAIIAHIRAELAAGEWFSDRSRRQQTVDRLTALEAPGWLVRRFKNRV